jgi:hypothetical protein
MEPQFQAVPVDETGITPKLWRSCCVEIDRDAVVYISGFCLITATVSFCFFQLINLKDCHSQQAYLSVLTLILGVLLPSPVIRRRH